MDHKKTRQISRHTADRTLTGTAEQTAKDKLGRYRLVKFATTQDGTAELQILAPTEGMPKETVRRHRDGSISHLIGRTESQEPVLRDRRQLIRDLEPRAECLLALELASGEERLSVFSALTEPKEAAKYRRALRRTAVDMAASVCTGGMLRRLTGDANRAVLARILLHKHWSVPKEHNWMLAQPIEAQRLRNSHPGFLTLLLSQLGDAEDPQPTAADLTERLSRKTALTPAETQWLISAAEAATLKDITQATLKALCHMATREKTDPNDRQKVRLAIQRAIKDTAHPDAAMMSTAQPILQEAIDTLAKKGDEEHDRITLINVRKRDRSKTLEVLKRDGIPQASLTRLQDGSLHWKEKDTPVTRPILLTRGELTTEVLDTAKAEIALRLLKQAHEEDIPQLLSEITTSEGSKAITEEARKGLEKGSLSGTGQPEAARFATITGSVNDLIRWEFMPRDTAALAEEIYDTKPGNRRGLNTPEYNIVARNQQALARLTESQKHLAYLWCTTGEPTARDAARYKHPGQIIRDLKEELQLPPRAWRIICNLKECVTSQYGGDLSQSAATAALAIADTKVELTTLQLRRRAADTATLTRRHREFGNFATWDHGSPWEAWTNALAGYIANARELERHPEWSALTQIADALRQHLIGNEPWTPARWPALTQRAENWHARNYRAGNRRAPTDRNYLAQSAWENPLPQTQSGEYLATPVTDGLALLAAATRMKNCADAYCQPCLDGTSRIYCLTAPDEEEVMVELVPRGDRWTVAQIEAPARAEVPQKAREAARILAALHSETDRKPTPPPNAQN